MRLQISCGTSSTSGPKKNASICLAISQSISGISGKSITTILCGGTQNSTTSVAKNWLTEQTKYTHAKQFTTMEKTIKIRISDDDMELLRTAMREKRWNCIQQCNDFEANRYQNLMNRIDSVYQYANRPLSCRQIKFVEG